MPNLFYYNAYNLCIESSIEFPGLITGESVPDVKIFLKRQDEFPSGKTVLDNPNSLGLVKFSNKDVGVLLGGKPFFRVRNGKEIIINSDLSIGPEIFRFMILNQGMGILLYQRGYLVLHGSAVIMNGGAVAFLGTSGAGKSTTTATLNLKGYPILTDDVLAIKFYNDKPFILPSFPLVKLREDVKKRLFNKTNSIKLIHQKSQEYVYNSNNNFFIDPIALKSIYILKTSFEPSITPIKLQDAIMELIKQSYAWRFFDDNEKPKNFFQCTKVVKNVPLKYLKRGKSINNHEDLLSKIENDINH